jgi:hypothetical protein
VGKISLLGLFWGQADSEVEGQEGEWELRVTRPVP